MCGTGSGSKRRRPPAQSVAHLRRGAARPELPHLARVPSPCTRRSRVAKKFTKMGRNSRHTAQMRQNAAQIYRRVRATSSAVASDASASTARSATVGGALFPRPLRPSKVYVDVG
eukprot:IDg2336t1